MMHPFLRFALGLAAYAAVIFLLALIGYWIDGLLYPRETPLTSSNPGPSDPQRSASNTDRTPARPRSATRRSLRELAEARLRAEHYLPDGSESPGSKAYAVHPYTTLLLKVADEAARLGIPCPACQACPVFSRPDPEGLPAIPPECRRCPERGPAAQPQQASDLSAHRIQKK